MSSPVQENPNSAGGDNSCHIVAMPYPGRGHINPMMNLCRSLSSKHPNVLITFVLTEEWFHLIKETVAANNNNNIRFTTIPNVIPSELVRAKDFKGFLEAVCTKLQAPFEMVLDGVLPSPVNAIIADTYLPWMCEVGSSRGIPVASLWTMPATIFSLFLHFDLLRQHRHFPIPDLPGIEEEKVNYIPGLPPTPILDIEPVITGLIRQEVLHIALECVSVVSKLQYLLFTSPYELESKLFDALKTHFQFPIYPVGPLIPHDSKLGEASKYTVADDVGYLKWLDAQPKGSVLYVSMGSFLSASESQTEEIVAGVASSCVRFLLVARGDTMVAAAAVGGSGGGGGRGMVVPWCDQLRVLCHSSVGGFWTHCGMNSTMEGVYAGVPMLCWPLFIDQFTNCMAIVDDWRIGWRARRRSGGDEELVRREEVAEMVRRFMDAEEENGEVVEMRKRASELREVCRATVAVGGSSNLSLDSFVRDILK